MRYQSIVTVTRQLQRYVLALQYADDLLEMTFAYNNILIVTSHLW